MTPPCCNSATPVSSVWSRKIGMNCCKNECTFVAAAKSTTLWPFFCSFLVCSLWFCCCHIEEKFANFHDFGGTKIGIQINLSMRVLNVCNRKKESNKKVNFGPVDDVFCVCKCATMPASLCVFFRVVGRERLSKERWVKWI